MKYVRAEQYSISVGVWISHLTGLMPTPRRQQKDPKTIVKRRFRALVWGQRNKLRGLIPVIQSPSLHIRHV